MIIWGILLSCFNSVSSPNRKIPLIFSLKILNTNSDNSSFEPCRRIFHICMKKDRWTIGKTLSQKPLQYLRNKNNTTYCKQNNLNTACSLPLSQFIFSYLFWFKDLALVGLEGICHTCGYQCSNLTKEGIWRISLFLELTFKTKTLIVIKTSFGKRWISLKLYGIIAALFEHISNFS